MILYIKCEDFLHVFIVCGFCFVQSFLWDRMWIFKKGFIAVVYECDRISSDEEHFKQSLVQLL